MKTDKEYKEWIYENFAETESDEDDKEELKNSIFEYKPDIPIAPVISIVILTVITIAISVSVKNEDNEFAISLIDSSLFSFYTGLLVYIITNHVLKKNNYELEKSNTINQRIIKFQKAAMYDYKYYVCRFIDNLDDEEKLFYGMRQTQTIYRFVHFLKYIKEKDCSIKKIYKKNEKKLNKWLDESNRLNNAFMEAFHKKGITFELLEEMNKLIREVDITIDNFIENYNIEGKKLKNLYK